MKRKSTVPILYWHTKSDLIEPIEIAYAGRVPERVWKNMNRQLMKLDARQYFYPLDAMDAYAEAVFKVEVAAESIVRGETALNRASPVTYLTGVAHKAFYQFHLHKVQPLRELYRHVGHKVTGRGAVGEDGLASTRALLFDFSALEIQIIRFVLAWLVLLGIGAAKRDRLGWRGRDEAIFAAMGPTGVFVYQFMENCAIYYTNASNVAILVSFGPIVMAAFARAFTKDRSLSLAVISGSLIAVCGVALVSLNGVLNFNMRPLGDLMALCAMTSWGVYSVLIGKVNERGVAPLTAIRKAFGWSLVMMLPLVVWGRTDSGFYALDGSFSINLDQAENALRFGCLMNWATLFFLGVLASALSFIAWSKACAALGVVRTTICLYLEPIIGVGFAVLFLGERPTMMNACGGVIIIVGVVVANWRRK